MTLQLKTVGTTLAIMWLAAMTGGCEVTDTSAKADLHNGHQTPQTTMSDSDNTRPSILRGTLTEDGVICRTMMGDDGELYAFEVIPESLNTGARISVVKSTTNTNVMSKCDQGKVLHWDSLSLLASDGTVETTWVFKDL